MFKTVPFHSEFRNFHLYLFFLLGNGLQLGLVVPSGVVLFLGEAVLSLTSAGGRCLPAVEHEVPTVLLALPDVPLLEREDAAAPRLVSDCFAGRTIENDPCFFVFVMAEFVPHDFYFLVGMTTAPPARRSGSSSLDRPKVSLAERM